MFLTIMGNSFQYATQKKLNNKQNNYITKPLNNDLFVRSANPSFGALPNTVEKRVWEVVEGGLKTLPGPRQMSHNVKLEIITSTKPKKHLSSIGSLSKPESLIMPLTEIKKLCNKLVEDVHSCDDYKDMVQKAHSFLFKDLKQALHPETEKKMTSKQLGVMSNSRHSLINCASERYWLTDSSAFKEMHPSVSSEHLPDKFKQEVKAWSEEIQEAANVIASTEDFIKNPNNGSNPNKVLAKVMALVPKDNNGQSAYSIKNQAILNRAHVGNPFRLHTLLSQPILNAHKYSDGKPFTIEFAKETKAGKAQYYMLVTNPHTTPIPNAEIDEILKGECYRASITRDSIQGTGFGISTLIDILRHDGHIDDVSGLIEKGRKEGVCVKVPLIGVTDIPTGVS